MDDHSRSFPAALDAPLPTLPHPRFPNFTPPDTPGNEIFAFDEPSSVLASRIMRAQDNPSPPPVSPSSKTTFTNDTKLVDVSEPTTPCYLNAQLPGHVVPLSTTPHSPSLLCALPSHQSPVQPHGDLITFDVEDEFTTTSNLTPSHYLNLPGPSGSRNTGDAPEVVKEDSCKETESPLVLPLNIEEAEIPQSDEPSTLVRRSGRNRRSTTPHQTFPSVASAEGHAEINSLIEPVPQASNAQTRVKRKSAKVPDVIEPQGHQSADKRRSAVSGLEQNNDASNAGHYSHHRLSSLSPTSSHVLNQLVTTSRDETPPFSKPSISTEFTLTTAMQHVDFQNTPSKESIYTRSPQRLQPDQIPSQITQVRTPARRIMAGEALPSRNKPFNTLPSTSSSHTFNFSLPRTPISCIPSGDSLARGATNTTNSSEDTLPEKTFSAEPLRISTPRRQLVDRSPSKNLPSAQFRTPARRIMVEEAPASNSKRSNLFPQTAASSNILNLGVARNPTFRINSNDSPVRRVIINDIVTDPKHAKRDNTLPQSLIRGTPVRSHSEEPSTTRTVVKSRSNSVEPRPQLERLAFPKSTDLRAPLPKLPFPLIPEAIPEEPVNEQRPGTSSVHISVLKQHTSKIPRIGIKPYARPTRSATNKLLEPVRRAEPPKQMPLLPSSSQSVRKNHTLDERTTHETASAHPTANSFTTGSKRKRIPDDTIFATKVSTTHPSTQPAARPIDTMDNTTPKLSNTPTAYDKSDSSQPPVVMVRDSPEQPSLNALTEEKYLDDLTPVPGPSKTPTPDSQPAETMESNSTKARRKTRTRTRTTPATTMTASRSSQSRRRVHNSTTSDTDVFNTMSAVALKALTNSNTVRNQQYIAAKIETEVIRKPGLRPTSPTVKTVLQRTQDEMSRERRERAQRRAQRNEEVLQNGCVGTQQRPESPTPIALHLNFDHDTGDSGRCDGHCKGAGDDGDYQPHDPQSKKRKVANGSEHTETRNGRRVKWDKGLYTEVRLDEIQLGARLLHKHQAILKGCLASTSKKAAQLDTLGNLPTASLPVADLVEECVVVKKFVYDDDEEPPQPPPPPIALGTRSKGKKNKP